MRAAIRIGTSGWEYRHWAGDFYPKGLPRDRWLEHYARQFDTVELNNPFYRLPSGDVFEAWGRRVPADFRFAPRPIPISPPASASAGRIMIIAERRAASS